MKKSIKIIPFATFAALFLVASNASSEESGVLNISGRITSTSCLIDSSQLAKTITLASISPSVLEGAEHGVEVANAAFSFDIHNCPAGTNNVGVKYNFTEDATHASHLVNTGDAAGVLLAITKDDGTKVAVDETVWSSDFNEATGIGQVQSNVKAYRVGTDTPGAGSIVSNATISLEIN